MKRDSVSQTKRSYVRLNCTDPLRAEATIKTALKLLNKSFWRPGMNILVDLRQAGFQDIRLAELRRFADVHSSFDHLIGAGRIVLLVDSVCHFGLARQYELLVEGTVAGNVVVCRDELEAVGFCENERELQTVPLFPAYSYA